MSCCAGSLPALAATERSAQADVLKLEELKRSAKPQADGSFLLRLAVPDVHCAACISKIESLVTQLEGISTARLNLSLKELAVTATSTDHLVGVVNALDRLGYRHHATSEQDTADSELKPLLRAVAVAGFAAANIMLLSVSVWTGADAATRDLFHFVSALIALPAVAYSGQPFFRSALRAIRHGRTNMDVPISLGVILATGMSLYESVAGGGHAYFDAAVSLLFFLLIGRALDVMMRGKARQLVMQMSRLAAKGAMQVVANGDLVYVTSDQVQPGMVLRVAAGERLPVDAVVLSGASTVDRSLVTGESQAKSISTGAVLEAGTLNLTSPLDIRALKSADQSFLGEVLQMLAAAEQGKGRYVRLADRMARIYAPAVHALALATFAAWMVLTAGDWHQAVTVAVAVLIITCPCALGLAVPVAHVVAASRLFKSGILVKDGSALERLAEMDNATFDKTGTLTLNAMHIEGCPIPKGGLSDIARSLALHSRHPAAVSLASHLSQSSTVGLEGVEEFSGFGVKALRAGKEYRLGRASWVSEIAARKTAESGLAFAEAGGDLFQIATGETLRPGALETMEYLARQNIPVEIMSGDDTQRVAKVAGRLHLSHYSANLTPKAKLNRLHDLNELGCKVLMVGDGLNDAPALAAAHVSIAPASASDIGRTAADFVFMGDSMEAVRRAHQISKQAARIVKQNLALAIAYNALAVPLAMAGYLNPFIAAIAMSTSSIIVIANSLRLGEFASQWRKGNMHDVTEMKEAVA